MRAVWNIAVTCSLALALTCAPSRRSQPGLFRSQEHRFSIVFPSEWVVKVGASEASTVVRAVYRGNSINVNVGDCGVPQADATTLTDAEIEGLWHRALADVRRDFPNTSLVAKGKGRLGDRPAWFLKYDVVHDGPTGSVNVRLLTYQTLRKGVFYTITATAKRAEYEEVEPLFLQAFSSFSLE